MELVKANKSDLDSIMLIIKDAQDYLASLSIDQWQNGYPDSTRILTDIKQNESYLVKNSSSQVMATTMFTTNPEPTYTKIEGDWLTPQNSVYGVIHRMAVGNSFRKLGIAKYIFNYFEELLRSQNITSMRIDTHENNIGMQTLLKTLGYSYCGIIYLDDNDKRLAFEKLIK
ncbi:GNAT family N-acetyltransferase [Aurantibacter sp.]|uniref:GNAT family N-acetyltransferase n=1 Tax=Aurantibacter sp. TaxID=2807103 RepID=UPI0035C84B90